MGGARRHCSACRDTCRCRSGCCRSSQSAQRWRPPPDRGSVEPRRWRLQRSRLRATRASSSIAAAGSHVSRRGRAPNQPAQGAGRRQPSSKRARRRFGDGITCPRAAAVERRAAQSSRRRGSCFAPCALITAVPVTMFSLPPVSTRIAGAGSNGGCLRSSYAFRSSRSRHRGLRLTSAVLLAAAAFAFGGATLEPAHVSGDVHRPPAARRADAAHRLSPRGAQSRLARAFR